MVSRHIDPSHRYPEQFATSVALGGSPLLEPSIVDSISLPAAYGMKRMLNVAADRPKHMCLNKVASRILCRVDRRRLKVLDDRNICGT